VTKPPVPGPHLAFALTVIYRSRYINSMESAFTVLAEPSRRAILTLLASGERSVGYLESTLNLSQPSVSKHLRVLRDAGLVEVTIDAQRRVYRIRPEPLQEVDAWMAPFRRYWSARVDALERHLDSMAIPTRTKRQSRKQR
jgi:DNA-binding transcriptional ArsR family regulator